MSITFKIKLK